MGDRWTRVLKSVKKQFQADLLEPIADIAADFLIENTNVIKDLDAVVPVPPSTEKFSERGFAPNDIVARHIGARLALPLIPVLCRRPGPPTREATDEELAVQFEVRSADGGGVQGLSLLLVEDIWTWGRTIPISAHKLISAGARNVVALALGKTEG
jgi:predicted amidophosphoribosyltransferase